MNDFDRRREYEEAILTIVNDLSRENCSLPEHHEEFAKSYAKPEFLDTHKKTVFLDVDGTILSMNP
eukprot:CAMPEP_0202957416 /NCGR_PEP_ID=MMETSP1396-20130829/1810_1 /ASSEMBLY_ACC=CAM_ASM_000872 /TAXON_ID= /ORGANISM="Pseudokeronopsis sp., Strain Brazil" /LENGTH=65 /DNA_ID=CAMNT_0049674877 /DNA_START=349 /DNA_END=546 /DNA_ORIENTATION=-